MRSESWPQAGGTLAAVHEGRSSAARQATAGPAPGADEDATGGVDALAVAPRSESWPALRQVRLPIEVLTGTSRVIRLMCTSVFRRGVMRQLALL